MCDVKMLCKRLNSFAVFVANSPHKLFEQVLGQSAHGVPVIKSKSGSTAKLETWILFDPPAHFCFATTNSAGCVCINLFKENRNTNLLSITTQ